MECPSQRRVYSSQMPEKCPIKMRSLFVVVEWACVNFCFGGWEVLVCNVFLLPLFFSVEGEGASFSRHSRASPLLSFFFVTQTLFTPYPSSSPPQIYAVFWPELTKLCESLMTRNFHRWEVDPFFSAAEEVQDSADRLESVYRTWIHVKSAADDSAVIEFHRRELSTALGTAKWQLEEFERAVSYVTVDDSDCAGDDTPTRHKQFVDALQSQISSIETALSTSEDGRDLKPHQVVKLGEKEKDDLELFLCGSRPSVCVNIKEAGFCTATGSKAGKADEVAPCAILDPLEGKNGIAPCFSTSAVNSDVDSANVKSDDCLWTHESNKLLSHFHKVSNGNLPGKRMDEISKPVSDPTPEYCFSDRERANGHLRSVSVGSGLNAWKSGSINDTRSKKRKLISVQIPSSRQSFWSVFAKARQPRSWRSGLKRWKDGDANASDSEMLALIQGVRDIEEGNGTLWFGGNSNCMSSNALNDGNGGDSKYCRAVGDGFQMWQRSHYALPSSRPVQLASAILVALGLVGLLSFHVTSSAF